MGDVGSPECSWKKMVIAKSNNKWISTIRSEQMFEGSTMNTSNFSLGDEQIPLCNIKRENEDDTSEQMISGDGLDTNIFIQEFNPLLIDTPVKRKRRKGSGPKCESPEERAARLAKMSAYAAQRLANETPEQRALRLRRMSEYAAKRLSQETSEQRAKRLARMSAYAARRLAKETPEQRQARLTRMSAYAARRQAMKKITNSTPTDSFNSVHSLSHFNMMNNISPDQS